MSGRCQASLVLGLSAALLWPANASAQSAAALVAAKADTPTHTRIVQPATIASSQDLMLAVSAAAAQGVAARATTGRASTIGSAFQRSTGATGFAPAPTQITFMVAGDSGQSISVTVPSAVGMTRDGGAEVAVLTTTTDLAGEGSQFLRGNFEEAGTLSFNVGGQVVLANNMAAGTYSGILAVVAQYN